ncbi:hypothetical protein 043JT007_66 [Bacillus phage 043JT007]|nr:hypothetical protein 043JT007_66 [Bacillus phage 043JT007]
MAQYRQFEYDNMTYRTGAQGFSYFFRGETYFNLVDALNILGKDGWELVMQDRGDYILKREIVVGGEV